MPEVTLEDLEEIFEEFIDLSEMQFVEQAMLGEDISIDSREMLRILSRIESRFRFRFKRSEVLGLKSLGDLLKVIRSRATSKE